MPKLRNLSAQEVITFFESHGFVVVSQKGSHIKLRKSSSGNTVTTVIPNHKTIAKGTLHTIAKKSRGIISEEKVYQFFYTE